MSAEGGGGVSNPVAFCTNYKLERGKTGPKIKEKSVGCLAISKLETLH